MVSNNGDVPLDAFRIGKAYTIRQAASLADVSQGTVRNWLYGMTAKDGYQMEPLFGEPRRKTPDDVAQVSFLELSELIVAAKFRHLRIALVRIRAAHDFARKEWQLEYPFAHLNLLSIGGHILRAFQEKEPGPGRFVVLSAPDQYVLPGLVQEELLRFDYSEEDKLALRWFPYGRDLPVVVDPHFAGGQPTIEGRGVSVEILRRRWKDGKESVQEIAKDFRLKPPIVEAVLQRIA